jgi:hypothetical protein
MYCCPYLLTLCAVVCAHVLCCYHVVLLPCCCYVATMLCCHVLLPCYVVVVLGLSVCSVVSL